MPRTYVLLFLISKKNLTQIEQIEGLWVAGDVDGEVDLVFGMLVGVDVVNDALEGVGPTHIQHPSHGLVELAWNVANAVVFPVVGIVEHHCHSVGVVRVAAIALQLQLGARFQMVPNRVGIVKLAARQVAYHELLMLGLLRAFLWAFALLHNLLPLVGLLFLLLVLFSLVATLSNPVSEIAVYVAYIRKEDI